MTKINRRTFTTSLAGAVGASLLPLGRPTAQAAAQLPRDYAGTTLRVLWGISSAWDIMAHHMQGFIDESGVKIDLTISPPSDRYTKMMLDVSTGTNTFDVYAVGYQQKYDIAPYLAELSKLGQEVPGAPSLDLDDYAREPLEAYAMVNGKMVALPIMGDVSFLLWNKRRYQAAGLDPERPPLTWQEVVENGKRLMGNHQFGYGMPGGKNLQTATQWIQLFCSSGGKYFSPSGQPQFNSPEAVAAMTFMVEQLEPICPSGNLTWDVSEVINGFTTEQSGQAMVWPAGMGIISNPATSAAAGHFGYLSPPGGAVLGGFGVGVNAKSKNSNAAKLFVAWITSKGVVQEMADAGAAPVRLSALLDPKLNEKYPHFSAVAKVFQGPIFTFPPVRESEQVIRIIYDQVNAALSKVVSPKQAADNMQQQVIEFMKRRNLI